MTRVFPFHEKGSLTLYLSSKCKAFTMETGMFTCSGTQAKRTVMVDVSDFMVVCNQNDDSEQGRSNLLHRSQHLCNKGGRKRL